MAQPTVRDAAIEVFRARGLTRMFANPGSTEVPLLIDLPADLEFVLGLHEGIGRRDGDRAGRSAGTSRLSSSSTRPPVSATPSAPSRRRASTARRSSCSSASRTGGTSPTSRSSPGASRGSRATYPVSVEQPVRPQELPGAIDRAWHAATTRRGPALVDRADGRLARAGAGRGRPARRRRDRPARRGRRSRRGRRARRRCSTAPSAPPLVVGAGADEQRAWDALVELAERLEAPVWQESFGARAGFPQDHPRFAGHLPSDRARLRARPRAVRRRPRRRRAGVPPVRVPAGAVPRAGHTGRGGHRRPRRGAPQRRRARRARPRRPRRARRLPRGSRRGSARRPPSRPGGRPTRPRRTARSRPRHVFSALAAAPAARRGRARGGALQQARAARADRGARAARVPEPGDGRARVRDPGRDRVRMARPERPVLAIVGDGSSLYAIQALWSAAHYGVGAVFVDPRERRLRGDGPPRRAPRAAAPVWPRFPEIDLSGLARSLRLPGASGEHVRRARGRVRRGRPRSSPAATSRSSSRSSSPPTRTSCREPGRAGHRPVGEDDHGAAAQAAGLHPPLRVGGLLGRVRLGDPWHEHAPHGELPHLPQPVRAVEHGARPAPAGSGCPARRRRRPRS